MASRLVDHYSKPSIVIGFHDGKWKGSGRSMEGINIRDILDLCSEMFIAYGGHAAAVGMTIKSEYIERAPEMFDKACAEYYKDKKINLDSVNFFDACLGPKAITVETAKALREKMYPYCKEHNPEPVFMLKDVLVYNTEVKKGDGWQIFKFYAQKDDTQIGYPFKMFSDIWDSSLEGCKVDVLFSFPQMHELKPNKWDAFELSAIDIIRKSD